MGKKNKLAKKVKKKDMGAKTRKKYEKKLIEDKTFGLKNKNKSKKVQNYMKQVKNKVTGFSKGKSEQQLIQEKYELKKKKEEEKRQKKLFSKMFGGTTKDGKKKKKKKKKDPKDTICPYFKVGLCQKGDKCKFSHDLEKESKSGKLNLYHDPRELKR